MTSHFFRPDATIAIEGVDVARLQGRHVLITGASGAVGIHLVAALRALAEAGADVFLTAVVHTDPPPPLASVFQHPFCRIVRADLSEPSSRKHLPAADLVVHCAGYGQPGRFLESPLKTIRINTDATCDLLARILPGGRFLFVSSTEVYSGLPAGMCYQEEQIGSTGPHHPRACYIEGKRCGEAACYAAFQSGYAAMSVRLAQTYGPGAKRGDRRALYSFIDQALIRKAITLLDSGDAVRTYCYAADAARMMLTVLLQGTQPVYNISGKTPITIRAVAEKVAGILQVPVSLPSDSRSSAGASDCVMVDMGRYEQEFGAPSYLDFETGLRRTADWHALIN